MAVLNKSLMYVVSLEVVTNQKQNVKESKVFMNYFLFPTL